MLRNVLIFTKSVENKEGMHVLLNVIENPNNIVIVNCNAGKGRTGTSIASFLMFSGLAENAEDAITYYGWKRFVHGRGVT